ncbi:PRAME family member 12-like [Perognathus longimembris pacificus]|uniref:PRAME family member 12-like n=1 Tax=Perognathus longimembris pacificus TaxID=214514 RepID=UPI0020193A4B|nr:PRAME family member 12-like [Perognathus longimembris pacificus]
MGDKAPPTLVQLATWKLLENQALAISALEELPCDLFPLLFMEALNRKCTKLLKAMVQAWPFPCLPLGSLMKKTLDLKTLKIALSGLDMLLAQKDRPRKSKLQVLDLRKKHQGFWNVCSQTDHADCGPPPPKKMRTELTEFVPGPGEKQILKVTVDLCLELCDLDTSQRYLFEWAKEKKGLVQLCCKKLQLWEQCSCEVKEWHPYHLLDIMDLPHLEDLELHYPWSLSNLAVFAFQLSEMRNLHTLFLSHVYIPVKMTPREEEQRVRVFTSHLGKLDCLRQLHLDHLAFLKGNLWEVLRSLKMPLESLSISYCQLLKPDFQCLPACENMGQLKRLHLKAVVLSCPKALQQFLEKVACTLETLELEDCNLSGSLLTALLPALSRCTQLTKVCFYGNRFSMPVLRKLIEHTAKLSQLSEEMYAVPLESYDEPDALRAEIGSQYCTELMNLLCNFREPRKVSFSVDPCPECGYRCYYGMDCLLSCQMSN